MELGQGLEEEIHDTFDMYNVPLYVVVAADYDYNTLASSSGALYNMTAVTEDALAKTVGYIFFALLFAMLILLCWWSWRKVKKYHNLLGIFVFPPEGFEGSVSLTTLVLHLLLLSSPFSI